MRLEVSLQQKQQLQLKLAPQMIQAIEILQLPNIDLKDRIDLELAENEVLEVDDESAAPADTVAPVGEAAVSPPAEGGDEGGAAIDAEAGSDEAFSETIERLASMADEDREAGLFRSRGEGIEASDRKLEALQATAAPPPSLQDLLADQLALLDAPETVMTVARAIVYSLDEDGLFPVHPLARPILEAMDDAGGLARPLEEIVDSLGGAAPAAEEEDGEDAGAAGAPPAPVAPSYGSWGGWNPGPRGDGRGAGPRDAVRAAAQREARRKGREDAREERLREAARVAASAASLRRRMAAEGCEADSATAALLFPLAEVLDLLEGEGLHATLDDASRALDLVQSLEPKGIGGRTAEETLLLQLRPGDPLRDRKRQLITHHLEDWKKNRLPRICQSLGASMDELKELLEEMSDLRPHPGAILRTERSPYLHPDVIIEWTEAADGQPDYAVRLVNEYFPSLRISPQYLRMFEDAATDPAVREMLKKKIGSARWLIDAIRQRQDTLLRVVREIVQHQKEFLDRGLTAMKPLKMQRIADDLGIHVSTVSRAIADKYAQTPQGILPLKFFFHGGTGSTDGSVESRLSVKDRVRQVIEQEDRRNPLSDEDLAARFKAEGLNIARRTVTKYRKQLGIASSRERREWE
jgi:RNA polymerase sigma-54 factor